MAQRYLSIFFHDCTSLSEVGMTLLIMASVSLILNSFPFYTLLNFSSKDMDPSVRGFTKTIKIYLLALVATEMFGCMIVVPLFLVRDLKNMVCWPVSLSKISVKTICALSFSSYFAYKIMSMFLTTFTGYSCILYFNQSARFAEDFKSLDKKNFVCEAQVSLTTTASVQSNQTNEAETVRMQRNSRKRPICFILTFIVVLSLFVPSLPYLGLGPFNIQTTVVEEFSTNDTLDSASESPNFSQCTLNSFASPKIEKEYIFLFSLLMASGGCCLILLFIFVCLILGRLKSHQKIFSEMIQLVSVQGFLFLITWIPLMVRYQLFPFISFNKLLSTPLWVLGSSRLAWKYLQAGWSYPPWSQNHSLKSG